MTKFYTVALATLALGLASCGKEEEKKPNVEKHPIIGVWKKESSTTNGEPDELDDCEKKDIITYTELLWSFEHYFPKGEGECELEKGHMRYELKDNQVIRYQDNNKEYSRSTVEVKGDELLQTEELPPLGNVPQVRVSVYKRQK